MIDLTEQEAKYIPNREKVNSVFQSLKLNWNYMVSKWKDYAKFSAPNSLRFLDRTYTDKGGSRRDYRIINPIGRTAGNIFAAGMMSLLTNKSNPWYSAKLTKGTKYGRNESEKRAHVFLREVDELSREAFGQSNYYQVMEPTYRDMGNFGTGGFIKEYDMKRHVRFRHLAPGSFMLDVDYMGLPNHFQMVLPMTVTQIMEKFFKNEDGTYEKEKIPSELKKRSSLDEMVRDEYEVIYSIFPNKMKKPNSDGIEGANFIGTYYLSSRTGLGGYTKEPTYGPISAPMAKDGKLGFQYDSLIKFEGYNRHPVSYCPWATVQEDPYGYDHPGELALNLIKQIQHAERRGGQATDYSVMPHFLGSSGLKLSGKRVDNLPPGGFTATRDRLALEFGLKPIHQTNFRQDHNDLRIQRYTQIINAVYFVEFILKISMMDKANISATQVNEASQERLMVLGPVYNRLEQNIFETSIQFMFESMFQNGALPEPPEELLEESDGEFQIGVEYVSTLSRALKAADVARDKDYLSTIADLSEAYPEMRKKVKGIGFANDLAKNMNVNPENIVTDEEVEEISKREMEQMQQQRELEAMQAQAKADKDESSAIANLPVEEQVA